jgi:predicted nucleotidyltransferase
MASTSLSNTQLTVLSSLAEIRPRFTLVGGAALAGFHLGHRGTRDLDLFWRGRSTLEELAIEVERTLTEAGFEVDRMQSAPAFVRLRVSQPDEVVIVDLVAEPAEPVHPDEEAEIGGARILVACPQEILADKLCALLGRAEIRDLLDVTALVAAGSDLHMALRDAPRKDAGFSPLTLAWVLRGLDVPRLARLTGLDEVAGQQLAEARDRLINSLLQAARPAEP